MRKFMLDILDYIKPYLAKNGGPIILAQIENEFVVVKQLIQQLRHVIHVIVCQMVG